MGPNRESQARLGIVISRAHRRRYSYAEYLTLEESSSVRHEFFDGEIYAMAGTPTHAALAAAIIGLVGAQLPFGCRAYTSDLRVRVPETGLSTYPDVTVVCGKTIRAVDDLLGVTNPVLLVEVTSPSTEDYDRGEKLSHYQRLPSVKEVLLVSHRGPALLLHRRGPEGSWSAIDVTGGQTLDLSSVGVRLAVDDVYRDSIEEADAT
jgi:Uma2 family endonuclease